MNIYLEKNNVIITGISDFSVEQTLECGQCFHFMKITQDEYFVSACSKLLHIRQEKEKIILINTTIEEYESIWKDYLDIERDYREIKEVLLERDDKLKNAIDSMWGVHILNQEFFETLISFIISQNQQIPRIKQIVAGISLKYGEKLNGEMYTFPNVDKLIYAGTEGMKNCKTGFRAPYIIDACEKYKTGILDEKLLRGNTYEECIDNLMMVKGIGMKVANCVALFSLGKRNAFPVDVWIKRIMEDMYFGTQTSITEIQELARDLYGDFGGYAQQYLFYYGKQNKIGK